MHGGGAKDDRLRIAIELEHNAGTLVASIEDSGREFDPTKFPPPSVAKSLEEAKVGDLGIHLMHSFASDMHYERRGRGQSANSAVCESALNTGYRAGLSRAIPPVQNNSGLPPSTGSERTRGIARQSWCSDMPRLRRLRGACPPAP